MARRAVIGVTSRSGLGERWAAPVIALLTVGALAADQGGYFPTSWGWAALLLLWAIGLWLVFGGSSEAGVLDGALIAAIGAYAGWVALSISWSDSVSPSVRESERAVLYLSAISAVVLFLRRGGVQLLAGAVAAAVSVVDVYSLCTRLFPDRLGVFEPYSAYRLSEPIGYWNGLGIFTAIGIMVAIGFAARGRGPFVRICAASSLVILFPTLYFTFSRGAWLALGVGLLCSFLYDQRRLQLALVLLLLVPAPAVATLLAGRSEALTHKAVPLAAAVHDGHRLALALLLLIPLSALCVLALLAIERRPRPSRGVRLAFGTGLIVLPVLALVLVAAHYGGPVRAVSRAYHSFNSPSVQPTNLNRRLLTLTNNGRITTWRVTWNEYESHPVTGSGAGTFARYWFRARPAPPSNAQDAHGLYIETIAELGPIGLFLLLIALLIPFFAAVRARAEPLAAFLLAAYVAFVLHAGVDWDLELPAVSLAGLFCGVALVALAREGPTRRPLPPAVRVGGLAVTLALTGFALFGLVGNSALSASASARNDHEWVKAEDQARKARRLMPWSPQPWAALGLAQAAEGNVQGARASFRRAIEKDPGDWTLWLKLAAVTSGRERLDAVRHVRRLNPLSDELKAIVARP